MENAVIAAKIGNKAVSAAAGVILMTLLLIGGYILWYTYTVYHSAFLGDDLLQYKPSLEAGDNASLYELMAENPDVCGWITIDGTNIDYPIVQGEDNLEYLNLDVFGRFSLAGSVFLDYENSRDFTDPYNVVYGHHMDNAAMFGQILDFLEGDAFEKYPTGILYLPDKTYAISFFAAMETNAYEPTILSVDKSSADMGGLLGYIYANAVQYRQITPALSENDRIISFVTCEDSNTDGRGALIGRLTEIEYVEQGAEVETTTENEWIEE